MTTVLCDKCRTVIDTVRYEARKHKISRTVVYWDAPSGLRNFVMEITATSSKNDVDLCQSCWMSLIRDAVSRD